MTRFRRFIIDSRYPDIDLLVSVGVSLASFDREITVNFKTRKKKVFIQRIGASSKRTTIAPSGEISLWLPVKPMRPSRVVLLILGFIVVTRCHPHEGRIYFPDEVKPVEEEGIFDRALFVVPVKACPPGHRRIRGQCRLVFSS
ncbi:unnamed protein product [Nezara viridula]|uniref:Uncharacterized protein n=1 Tax=Nezara viridula TaxID=85310 RepID=A0A9P0MWU8_NEZVI|nr:unnamed protein product [Nezara viridula]